MTESTAENEQTPLGKQQLNRSVELSDGERSFSGRLFERISAEV